MRFVIFHRVRGRDIAKVKLIKRPKAEKKEIPEVVFISAFWGLIRLRLTLRATFGDRSRFTRLRSFCEGCVGMGDRVKMVNGPKKEISEIEFISRWGFCNFCETALGWTIGWT
jgi:hypothetical protein